MLAATIMPDHVHWLCALTGRLPVPRCVAKFKAATRSAFTVAGVSWQENFFEHRLRPGELAEVYARYVFMNPYRAGLLGRVDEWPHWRADENAEFGFLAMLVGGRLPPAVWFSEEWKGLGIDEGKVGEAPE